MKVSFYQLGCDKNKVDGEKILKDLIDKYDIEIVEDPRISEICIVNTCAFIRDAKLESIKIIKNLQKLKSKSRLKRIVIIGCLTNDKTIDLSKYLKKEDRIYNIHEYLDDLFNCDDRVRDILSFSSSLKISDGCDKKCSYCIIPRLRGHFRSSKIEKLVKETKKLSKLGTTEISIVAQDTLSYGIDLYKKKMIVPLINKISKIDGIRWIRLMYCYPESIDDSLINLIKNNKKVLHYIDMPIQHINDDILISMNRATRKENIKNVINKLRNNIPDIIIRTTFIVGYPGETKEKYEELIDFIKEMKLDKVGAFAYSREKGTESYGLPMQIDEKEKKERLANLLKIQNEISISKKNKYIGNTYDAIIEGYDTKSKSYIARTYMDARDIDEVVYVKSNNIYISGDYIKIRIIGLKDIDLIGEEI